MTLAILSGVTVIVAPRLRVKPSCADRFAEPSLSSPRFRISAREQFDLRDFFWGVQAGMSHGDFPRPLLSKNPLSQAIAFARTFGARSPSIAGSELGEVAVNRLALHCEELTNSRSAASLHKVP